MFESAIAALFVIGAAAAAQAQPVARADVDRDCTVTRADATIVQGLIGRRTGQPGFNANADVNNDGIINNTDLTFVTRNLGASVCSTPPAAPAITATVTPAANANGWHRGDVTISFACTNATSCPAAAVISTEGAGQVIERTVANSTGATATARVTLNIDKTPPVVVLTVPPTILRGGALPIPLTITDLSGAASSTLIVRRAVVDAKSAAPFALAWTAPVDAPIGSDETLEIIVEDRAGNTSSTRRPLAIDVPDTTAPTVTVRAPAKAAPGATVPVVVEALDDRALGRVALSQVEGSTTTPLADRTTAPFAFQAVATVPANATNGSTVTFAATATDAANNTGSGTATVEVVTSVETTALQVIVDPPVSPTFQAAGVITGSIGRGTTTAPPTPTPIVASIAPTVGRQGQTLDVVITGINTTFTALSQVTFGPGVTVASIAPIDATHLTARVIVAANASLGPRVVAVSTGTQEGLLASAFSVVSGLGTLNGRVLTAHGAAPIANAQICLQGSTAAAAPCVTTNVDGRFTLPDVPVDARRVVASAPGYDAAIVPFALKPGVTVPLGDLTLVASNVPPPPPLPNSPPIAPKLATVLGRGATEFEPGGDPEQLRKLIRDTIVAVGGKELGVLDESGQQLNPQIGGAGYASFSNDAVEQLVVDMLAGDTISLAELFKIFMGSISFPDPVKTPNLLQLIAGLQDSIDTAWANPGRPDSPLLMVLFNQGRVASATPPRINFDTRFNALQKDLLVTSFAIFVNRLVLPQNGGTAHLVPLTPSTPPSLSLMSRLKQFASLLSPRGVSARASMANRWRQNTWSPRGGPRIPGLSTPGEPTVAQGGGSPYLPTNASDRPTSLMWDALLEKTVPNGGWTVAKNAGKLCDEFLVSSAKQAAGAPPLDGKSPEGKALAASDPAAKLLPSPSCKDAISLMEALVVGRSDTYKQALKNFGNFVTSETPTRFNAARIKTVLESKEMSEALRFAKQEAAKNSLATLAKVTKVGASFVEGHLAKLQGEMVNFLLKWEVELVVQSVRPRAPFIAAVRQLDDEYVTPAEPTRFVEIKFNRSGNDHGTTDSVRWWYQLVRFQGSSGVLLPAKQFKEGEPLVFHDEVPADGTYEYRLRGVRRVGYPLPQPPNPPDPKSYVQRTIDFLAGFLPTSVSIAGHQVVGVGVLQTVGDPLISIYKQIQDQASDLSDPAILYVSTRPPIPRPPASLAVSPFTGQAYLSVPTLNTVFKVGPGMSTPFAAHNFKEPGAAGLAVDSIGNLYTDNAASDAEFGGRLFSFSAFDGARTNVGTVNYFSQMLMYANPVSVQALLVAPGQGGEQLYIADGFNQRITRLTLPASFPPGVTTARNVSQPYSISPLFQFGPSTTMAMRSDGWLAVTQNDGIVMVNPFGVAANLFGPVASSPFQATSGVAFDAKGHMYVSDSVPGTITQIPFWAQHAGSGMAGLSDLDKKKRVVKRGLRRPTDIELLASRDGLAYFDGERAYASFKFGMSGQVTDGSGAALGGATVHVPLLKRKVVADADGIYVMTDLVAEGQSPIVDYIVKYDGKQQSYRVVLDSYTHSIVDVVFNPPGPPPPPPPGIDPIPPPRPQVTPPVRKSSSGETVSVTMDLQRDAYPSSPAQPTCPRGVFLAPAYGAALSNAAATITGVLTNTSVSSASLVVNGAAASIALTAGEFSVTRTLQAGENTLAIALPASILKPLGCADASLADADLVNVSTAHKVFHDTRPEVLANYRAASGFDLSVRGLVREGGRPIAGLDFYVPGTGYEGTTDGDGVFQVNVPKNSAGGATSAADTLATELYSRIGSIVALLRNERRAESLAALEALLLQAEAINETPPDAAASVEALLGRVLEVEGTAARLIQSLESVEGIANPADITALEQLGAAFAGINSNGEIVVRSRDYPELFLTVSVR